ncbi:MAG: tetratricopeptide repeat protein [Nitrospinaceae bacterium]
MEKSITPCRPFFLTLALLSVLGWSGCMNLPLSVESHFNRGVEKYDEGRYADAIEEYKLALRKNPDDFFAKYNLAVVYQDQGKEEKAEQLYNEILSRTEDTNSRINLAAIYYFRGDHDQAFQELRTAAEKNRDSPDPLGALGEYLEGQEQYEEAEKNYLAALAIDDKDAFTLFRLGRLYCKMEKVGPCMENLQKAVELNPQEPAFLETLANEHEMLGHPYEAINLLERVSVLQPDQAEIFTRLGDLYKSEQLYQEAVQRYWSAAAIRDNNPHVHRSLAEIFERLTQREQEELKKMEDQNSLAQSPPSPAPHGGGR